MELRITSNSQIALFHIEGKIGWNNSRILDTQIHKIVERGCKHIVFDLNAVTFLCSGGIGALIYHLNSLQSSGGDIYILSTSEYIQNLFTTIGFNIVFRSKTFRSFDEFSRSILQPRGLSLNLSKIQPSVVSTEEHRFKGDSQSAA